MASPKSTNYIQHDGATAHIKSNDQEFRMHANQGMWNISLEMQPAKSPDTNVLDLSFFRALQAAQWSLGSETTIDGLIAQTLQAFAEFEPQKIDFGFLTLQSCLDDILTCNRGNDYKLRHIGKSAMLLQNGTLPQTNDVTENALYVYNRFVDDDGSDESEESDASD